MSANDRCCLTMTSVHIAHVHHYQLLLPSFLSCLQSPVSQFENICYSCYHQQHKPILDSSCLQLFMVPEQYWQTHLYSPTHRGIYRYCLQMYRVDTMAITGLAMDSTFVTEKVVQHLIKCTDYHQLKTVLIQIDYTISTLVVGKLKWFRNDFYTLLFISFSPNVKYGKNDIDRMIVFLYEFDFDWYKMKVCMWRDHMMTCSSFLFMFE